MTLQSESGGGNADRVREARRIIFDMGLKDRLAEMSNQRSVEFVESTAERLKMYGDKTIISPGQLFWLRDLKDRLL
jgi:hypothetical protein